MECFFCGTFHFFSVTALTKSYLFCYSLTIRGGIVQSVEQRTHIPYVGGSIPLATNE